MTPREIVAYNAGVAAVLDLARATSAALAPRLVEMPTRFNFAMGALDGIAEEGRALLIPLPPSAGAAAPALPVTPKPSSPALAIPLA